MKRANYIGAPEFYHLNNLCAIVVEAFGWNVYLVGSSIEKRDYRDVDIRCILGDEEFDRLFPGAIEATWRNARWSLICAAISEWLSARSKLPIDFQIQRMTQANDEFSGPRHALGIFIREKKAE